MREDVAAPQGVDLKAERVVARYFPHNAVQLFSYSLGDG
jgi:hypothetical protein